MDIISTRNEKRYCPHSLPLPYKRGEGLRGPFRATNMIFYFSATGNTRWIALQIAEAIGEETVYIPDAIRQGRYEYTLKEGERIGFCFPTHGWQPPGIVRRFIARMQVAESADSFCWALTTCGDNMGEAMTILNKDLAAKGIKAETLYSVLMPETYICLPFMKTDTEEKVRQKVGTAEARLPGIIDAVRERRRGIVELERGATPRLYSYVIGGYFNSRLVNDEGFAVDADVCIRCGKCAQVCPVDNIEGQPPVWLHNGQCTSCLACYHYCPVHAISKGERTKRRGQYYFGL